MFVLFPGFSRSQQKRKIPKLERDGNKSLVVRMEINCGPHPKTAEYARNTLSTHSQLLKIPYLLYKWDMMEPRSVLRE